LLDRASAASSAHHYEDARSYATKAISMAREDDDRVRLADALHKMATLQRTLGESKEAAENFEAAAWMSLELDEADDATSAWLHLMDVTGDDLGQDDTWPRWEKAARASLVHLQGQDRRLEWHLENALGGIDERNGRQQEALVHYQRALNGIENYPEDKSGLGMHLYNNVGIAHLNLGQYDDAIASLTKARELYVDKYGAEHPNVAAALGNLGNTLGVTGKYDEAIAMQREALRIVQASMPPGHLDIAAAHDNLGNALDGAGKTEEAIEHMRRALAFRQARLGGKDASVGISSNNLGDALMRLGRMDEAVEHVERACSLFESDYGKDHPHTGVCYNNLARVRHHQGRSREALDILDRALEIHAKAFGDEHPILAYHLVERGRVLRDQGQRSGALEALERAVKLRTEGQEEATLRGEACFELAKTLPANQLVRARNLAERAQEAYRSAGEAAAKQLTEVEGWLSKHGP
jgi:tetratricopeptide (TPR) repeat protein